MGLGNRIGQILKDKNMTVKEFANITGISPTTLYSIIKRDNNTINTDHLKKIAEALGLSIEQLLDGDKLITDDQILNLKEEYEKGNKYFKYGALHVLLALGVDLNFLANNFSNPFSDVDLEELKKEYMFTDEEVNQIIKFINFIKSTKK